MNQRAFGSALGRSRLEVAAGRASQCLRGSNSSTSRAAFFTTTSQFFFPDQGHGQDGGPTNNGRQRSAAAASELGSLRQSSSSSPSTSTYTSASTAREGRGSQFASRGGIGASRGRGGALGGNSFRTIGIGGGAGTSTATTTTTMGISRAGAGASNVISVTSLRGSFRGRGWGQGRGGFSPSGGATSRFAGRGGDMQGGQGRGRGFGMRGRGGGARGGVRGGRRRRGEGEGDSSRPPKDDGKLTWNPEEREWLNRIEQGTMTEYTPRATPASLVGYGPALATDAAIGRVETAMRSMRILGGARPFDGDVTTLAHNPRDDYLRYEHRKKPLFFHSMQEKRWIRTSDTFWRANSPFWLSPAHGTMRAAILGAAIRGRYKAPAFVDMTDTMGTLASYHARQETYKVSDAKAFDEKVLSLMPALAPKTADAGDGEVVFAQMAKEVV